jgi:hypothetical protein
MADLGRELALSDKIEHPRCPENDPFEARRFWEAARRAR